MAERLLTCRRVLLLLCVTIIIFLSASYKDKVSERIRTTFDDINTIEEKKLSPKEENKLSSKEEQILADKEDIILAYLASEKNLSVDKKRKFQRAVLSKTTNIEMVKNLVTPQINCSNVVRVGNAGDGGKWVCNPENVKDPCITYSFGVLGDTSFEADIFKFSKKRCKIYSFDVIDQKPLLFTSFEGTFKKWKIVGVTNESSSEWAILDIAKHFGHQKIKFLKVDIEGGEYDSLFPFLSSAIVLDGGVCQLFVELHTWLRWQFELYRLLQSQLEKIGFLLFSKECNPGCCCEYSYIHQTCLMEFGVDNIVSHKNFD